jgi:hypothetical protein
MAEVWAEWLGEDPKPGTIYKDVLDMRAARRVWEAFQTREPSFRPRPTRRRAEYTAPFPDGS